MLQVLNTLAPVFLTILLGLILTKKNFLSKEFLHDLNNFIYWIGLPLLIIKSLADATSLPHETLKIIMLFLGASGVVVVLSFILCKGMQVRAVSIGTFVQAAFRGNLAFVAIPVILFAMKNHSQEKIDNILTMAIFTFAPTMIFYNIASVIVLVKYSGDAKQQSVKKMFISVLSNPLILSSIVGVILYYSPYKIPKMLMDSFAYVGNVSGPTALICVGGAMAHASLHGQKFNSIVAAILKVFILPIIAYSCTFAFKLSEPSMFVLLILSASPTATASYVLVKVMKGDEDLASTAIVLSHIFSLISLSLVISFFTPALV